MTDIKNIFNFEGFALNGDRRELKYADKLVEIEPRAFDLLIYLLKNSDRAVSKDELQDAVWPGMIVTETALTRAVMKARKAIGDDANRQDMIKTLHGFGYRFTAKLSEADAVMKETPTELEAETGAVAEPATVTFRLRSAVLMTLALVLIAGFAWMLLRPPPSSGGETRIAVLPLLDNTDNQELAWTSLGLMSYANKLIANDGSMLVVPAGSVISLSENFTWNGDLVDPANDDLLSKLRQAHGATHVLAMELETEGRALRMNYSLLGPAGRQQMGTIVGDGGTDLAHGVVQAVYGIMFRKSHLGGDTALVSEDSFNNEAFARGMDLSLQGRCNEAVRFFRIIIEQEPRLFSPRFEYAACLRIMGEPEEAEALLTSLIDEQRSLGASLPLAQSLMTMGIVYNRTGRLDPSQQAYEEALRISEEIGDHVLSARILQNLSIVYKSRSELDEASRLLDLALLAYQDAGLETLPGHLYSGRANLNMARGELVEADVELAMALAAFREIGDRRNEAMMLNNTGYLRHRQGRLEEAEAYHLRSLEIREEIGDRVGVGRIYGMLSGVYAARGQYEDAILAAQSALEVANETQDRLFEGTSLAQLATAKQAVGDLESARLFYLEAKNIFKEIQDLLRSMQSDLKIAQLDVIENRLSEAQEVSLKVLNASREHELMPTEVEALELLGDIKLAQGNMQSAIHHYNSALERVQETTWTSKENTLDIKLANVYMDTGELEAAAPLVGAMAAQEANVRSLKARARFSFMRDDAAGAAEIMLQARVLAAEHWSDANEATLRQYQSTQPR